MNKFEYELLKFIYECPEYNISKSTMYNALKWDYTDLSTTIKSLKEKGLLNSFELETDKITMYNISDSGYNSLKRYPRNNFKILFKDYIFPTITFLLGILISWLIS